MLGQESEPLFGQATLINASFVLERDAKRSFPLVNFRVPHERK